MCPAGHELLELAVHPFAESFEGLSLVGFAACRCRGTRRRMAVRQIAGIVGEFIARIRSISFRRTHVAHSPSCAGALSVPRVAISAPGFH
jgi:hypothetical protein